MKLLRLFITVSIFGPFLLFAEEKPISGGESGYDTSLFAIEPSGQNMISSLAGEAPADISRYIWARDRGAKKVDASPDGKHIAFEWSITGTRQIWLVAKTGGQPKQLTFGSGVSFFEWAPDSQSLIYGADNNGNEQEAYYQISIDGQQEKLILPSMSGGFRQFGDFINQTQIAYASTERNQLDFDIYIANLNTQKTELIFAGNFGYFVSSVSPNGRYAVINEAVGEDSDNLYLLDIKSKQMSVLSKPERRANHSNAGISWTADSKGFYLASNLERDFTSLMHFTIDGTLSLVRESSVDINNVLLCGEDAQFLIWNENLGGYSQLRAITINDNAALKTPVLAEGVYNVDCNIGHNTVTIGINGWDTPGDIINWDIGTGKVTNPFSSQLVGLSKSQLVKPESISLKARDGITVHGLLYMPVTDSKQIKKPPVLFRVHGGPTAQSRPIFDDIAQYYTAKGIAIFLPNVRGSTGFGHHYVALDDRGNRLNSIRDLVDMLAHLEQDGRVDVKRAGIAGGSYGGYAVNAVLANYPGHFIAGASLYGVADWVTALQIASPGLKASDRIEYGDISQSKWLDFYTVQSPIRQANNIDVPVLFSHGVMDPRIDISETEIMVKTLRKNNVEAPFIRIPDEGHGWRKNHNRLFYFRQEADFFERKLGLIE